MLTSDKTYWLDANRENVVEDGSEQAAFLLVREGGSISEADAEKYGLTGLQEQQAHDARAEHEAKHMSAAPENKAQLDPSTTKAPQNADEGPTTLVAAEDVPDESPKGKKGKG